MPFVRRTKKRRQISRPLTVVAAICAVVVIILIFAGLSGLQKERLDANAAAAENYQPVPLKAAAEGAVTSFAAVGDSITQADSPDLAAGKSGSGSWTNYADDSQTEFVGGWARGGATTDAMAAESAAIEADRLVILAGTNDISQGVPFERTAANLRDIAAKLNIESVIVSAIPPFDLDPSLAVVYNEDIEALAASEGWTFVDPMNGLRNGDVYGEGMTLDGVHPTPEAARIIGDELRAAIIGRPD